MSENPKYHCPICSSQLKPINKSFSCDNNHCFDIAKENYLNLLPVQFKHSKNPGDNKLMVNARRSFLEKNYYQPLIEKITAIYNTYGNTEGNVLDAGCGEGYYTHQHKTKSNYVYGVDIAKEAIKKAAKKYHECSFSVATLSQLPFSNDFFDWIFSIYAPLLEEEFTRVITKNGYLLTVTPAEKHLYELKNKIYNIAQEHDISKEPIKNLTLIHQEKLTYEMTLKNGEDTLNLLSMTPFAFKASEAIKLELKQTLNFSCHADFLIRLYQK